MSVDGWRREATYAAVIGLNRRFLEATVPLNRPGDMFPPWRVFPEYSPETSGWRQGDGEYWWHAAWAPFWSNLTPVDKQLYLARWGASQDWVERLTLSLSG